MKNRKVKLNGKEFTLGKKYTDTLLGNSGIATAGIIYLTGCDQLQLRWNDSTGRPVEEWVDVVRIELYKEPEWDGRIRGGPSPSGLGKAPSDHIAPNQFSKGMETDEEEGITGGK